MKRSILSIFGDFKILSFLTFFRFLTFIDFWRSGKPNLYEKGQFLTIFNKFIDFYVLSWNLAQFGSGFSHLARIFGHLAQVSVIWPRISVIWLRFQSFGSGFSHLAQDFGNLAQDFGNLAQISVIWPRISVIWPRISVFWPRFRVFGQFLGFLSIFDQKHGLLPMVFAFFSIFDVAWIERAQSYWFFEKSINYEKERRNLYGFLEVGKRAGNYIVFFVFLAKKCWSPQITSF